MKSDNDCNDNFVDFESMREVTLSRELIDKILKAIKNKDLELFCDHSQHLSQCLSSLYFKSKVYSYRY